MSRWSGAVSRARRWNRGSRIHKGRFAAAFLSGLLALVMMIAGMLLGIVPVSAELVGDVTVEVSIRQLTTSAGGVFPQLTQTRAGDRQIVLAVDLHDTRAEEVCVSGAVDSVFGTQVLRITSRPGHVLAIAEVSLAMDAFADVRMLSGSFAIDGLSTTPDGIVVLDQRPGRLPIEVHDLKVRIHATIRWVSLRGVDQSGVDMDMGHDVTECF